MPTRSRAGWPSYVLVIPALLVVLLVFRLVYPSWESSFPSCPILKLTGAHCPGCGGTRSAAALVHFKITEALGYHAWFTLVILLGLPMLFWMALKEKYPQIIGPRFHPNWLWFCLFSLIIFGVLRNIEACRWLAPPPVVSP